MHKVEALQANTFYEILTLEYKKGIALANINLVRLIFFMDRNPSEPSPKPESWPALVPSSWATDNEPIVFHNLIKSTDIHGTMMEG